jgi:hypothetical protein
LRLRPTTDLHFYLDDACVWVVLLDATAERDQAQRVQQKAYDMSRGGGRHFDVRA